MMKKVMLIVLTLCLMVFFLAAGDFPVKESETIIKELSFAGGSQPRTCEIDNVFGSIKVSGYNGETVKLTARKTLRAKSAETLQKAKAEVKLNLSSKDNHIAVVVDGPFRTDKNSIHWNTDKMGYIVRYDFEVSVPHQTGLRVKTINEGDIGVGNVEGESAINNVNGKITIDQLKGDFSIHTVNGGIIMTGITGSGQAHTVNGKVSIHFDQNPGSDCSFKTVNGNLELTFLPGLSADFQLKTFNGKIYSDFPSDYLPVSPQQGERKQGKYVYKSSNSQGIRIGNGGPAIKMDTLNGNIIISKD
jgi:hypothetical protein